MTRSDIKQPNDWNVYRLRATSFAAGHNVGAVSGAGSTSAAAAPLVKFLLHWLSIHREVQSMVEASSGHWPSGWQSRVVWPRLQYAGVDIVKEQVEANRALVAQRGLSAFGLQSAVFLHANMTHDPLPSANLLLTKDTLIHMPLRDISRFLKLSVISCRDEALKYVLFVHDQLGSHHDSNVEINRHGSHPLDFSKPPFSLNVTTIFVYPSGRCCKKAVQLLNVSQLCRVS